MNGLTHVRRTHRKEAALAFLVVLAAAFFWSPSTAGAEIQITLKNSFIEKYKNRATIETTFTVDKAHSKPNTPKKDGDLHIAGRAPEVGLPIVAEIMNAATRMDAVDLIHEVEGSSRAITLLGAWRIWCEHGGGEKQVQGMKIGSYKNANPDHVFEVHPVTTIEDKVLAETLVPIKGFVTKDAHDAFVRYEGIRSKIVPDSKKKTTTILTTMAGYNYVEFIMELNDDPKEIEDGRMAFASVHDLEGELLVRNRRMVFIKDTPPEIALRGLKKGDQLHVLGLPRIDLALVSWRTKNSKTNPSVLTWNLPYEIIVVGVYND